MAKRKNNNRPTKRENETEKIVDQYSQRLQLIAIAVVVLFVVMNAFIETKVPTPVILGFTGLAIGLNPQQLGKIITDVLKSVVGKK